MPDSPDWQVEVLFDFAPDRAELENRLAIAAELTGITPPALELVELPDQDWVQTSLDHLQPVSVGRFYLHGSHTTEIPPAGSVPIRIDAGRAFGTGQHETTQGCLAAIDALSGAVMRPLDLGTGTGVLAIAMAKVWQVQVRGSDIDPVAVAAAMENAGLNEVADLTDFAEADGLDGPFIQGSAPYDLIVANILARPLIELAPAMVDHLADGGQVLLSGLLEKQRAGVLTAYQRQGLTLNEQYLLGEWPTLLLRKTG